MSFAEGGDGSLERVIAQNKFFLILACLSGFEVEYQLFNLSNLQNTLTFANLEAGWGLNLPLGGFFADVSKYDRFFVVVLDGYEAEVKLIWEVEDSSAAHRADRNNELFSLCDDHKIIRVVTLSLGEELDDVGDLHAWGDFARQHIDVLAGGFAAQRLALGGSHGRFLGGGDREQFTVRRDDLDGAGDTVLVPKEGVRDVFGLIWPIEQFK